ncbi:MAG: MaoC/PaaZ C-terminal domain-containing protein [Candidatus Omnitrophota bacterium]
MAKSMLLKNINKGTDYSAEFEVSPGIIELFSGLTGDYGSLHTDKAFGRRSMYRKNIVYGMLPVLFIPALKICYANEYRCYFQKISAEFIKPVFADDRLRIESEIAEINAEQGLVRLGYAIKNVKSNVVLTRGYFTLIYTGDAMNTKCARLRETAGYRGSMVMSSLREDDLQFNQICKDDGKDFQFLISKECLYAYYEILTQGLLPDYRFDFSDWIAKCDAADILANALFSTFVGMCIPGRYAIFTGFNLAFNKPIECDKKYTLAGKVGFKSESTFTLVENMSIYGAGEQKEISASGTLKAMVHEPLFL